MDFLTDARRRAFSVWLRTGRLSLRWARGGAAEVKFNPWHDPDDGRFTFAGTGRYFGRGSSSREQSGDASFSRNRRDPSFGGFGGGGQGFNGGGAGGSWEEPKPDAREEEPYGGYGDGSSNGAGASGNWPAPDAASRGTRRAIDTPRSWRRVEANGYVYLIDSLDRTREISGTITYNPSQRRSRSAQARAGGSDRRPSDHGGHYVARELNGPPGGINLFAQDANFNRREYREMENQWRKAVRAEKQVRIKIVPRYPGPSGRPSVVNVWFWIDGNLESLRFPNEPRRK